MDPAVTNIILFILGVCGTLMLAIATMIYRRIGIIEALMRDAVNDLSREDKLLHGRISASAERLGGDLNAIDRRVTQLETRCDSINRGGAQ